MRKAQFGGAGNMLFLFIILFAAGRAAELQSPSFTLNGESVDPSCRTLRSLGFDRNEIVVLVDGVYLILDEAESYTLTGDIQEDGRLFLHANEKRLLVGLRTHKAREDQGRRSIDPFAGLGAADMEQIRGVSLELPPSVHALDLLDQVDFQKVFFRVTGQSGTGTPKKLPAIPNDVVFLDFDPSHVFPIEDFSYFQNTASLAYLSLERLGFSEFDVAQISDNRELIYLKLDGRKLLNVDSLHKLQGIRMLDLSWCNDVKESGFIGNLPNLRELDISCTGVQDLTPLETLEYITRVNANESPISRLPKTNIPTLQELRVMDTALSDEEVAVFGKENPQCRVFYDWNSTLKSALQGVDHIRVRSGGTTPFRFDWEKTLFEIDDMIEVNNTIGQIVLDPVASGTCCECIGDPSFEFYQDGQLVLTLGFHHGRSLRWMDGDWPADGALTPESSDALCELLARHGVDGPRNEKNRAEGIAKAKEARKAVYSEILPEDVKQRLRRANTGEERLHAFIAGVRDKAERVLLALKLLGAIDRCWNYHTWIDQLVTALLKNEAVGYMSNSSADLEEDEMIAASDIVDVFSVNMQDSLVVAGAARWFLGEKNLAAVPVELQNKLLPVLAQAGMTHPYLNNRRQTLYALEDIGSQSAVLELRKVLNGQFKLRTWTPAEDEDYSDTQSEWVIYVGEDKGVGDACSDAAFAALILARSNDHESLPIIHALLEAEQVPESKKVLEEAISILEKAGPIEEKSNQSGRKKAVEEMW